MTVRLLLDTHIALWAIADSRRLSKVARDLIRSPEASIWVSVATIWEIAIKHAMGKGDMPESSAVALRYFRDSGYRFLPVEPEHAVAVEAMPVIHRDPFDRLLIAQAAHEGMILLTSDAVIAKYPGSIRRV